MIVTVIGARPQFVKAAVVSKALKDTGLEEIVVHTGQHYDDTMSKVFWDELHLPSVHINLEAGSGTQGVQTATIIEKLEAFLLSMPHPPKAILVYGDTNSTLAASIVASKLLIPIIHVEAGLRSFNRSMPEEINRVVTDHLSSVLFCSSAQGVQQLEKEGITQNVYNCGDVMYDAVKIFSELAERKSCVENISHIIEQKFCLLTLHRPANTDNEANVSAILNALRKIAVPVLWPLHPRLKSRIDHGTVPENVHIVEPLSYFQMLSVLKKTYKIFTDSGGLQKEAYWLQKPCITLRTETEWVETLHHNWNIITGANEQKIVEAYGQAIAPKTWQALYGEGDAASRIAGIIKKIFYSES